MKSMSPWILALCVLLLSSACVDEGDRRGLSFLHESCLELSHDGTCVANQPDASCLEVNQDPAEATRKALSLVRYACSRLHGECRHICGGYWDECYGSDKACVDDWADAWWGEWNQPSPLDGGVFDPVLGERCAAQIDDVSCDSLPDRPETLECAYTMVRACISDDDDFGTPYSPFRPAVVPPAILEGNGLLRLRVCEGVSEYYSVTLLRGQRLWIEEVDRTGIRVNLQLGSLLTNANSDAEWAFVDSSLSTESNAVPDDGTYLLVVNPQESGRVNLSVLATQ